MLRGTTVGPPYVKSRAPLVVDQSGELSVTADRVLRLRLLVSVQSVTVTRDVTAAV